MGNPGTLVEEAGPYRNIGPHVGWRGADQAVGLHVDQAFGFYACWREVEALQAPLQTPASAAFHARFVMCRPTAMGLPLPNHSMLRLARRLTAA